MVNFSDVIPYLLLAFVAVGIILLMIVAARLIEFWRNWLSELNLRRQQHVAERKREGPFWYIAEVLRVLLVVIVVIVSVAILDYLINAPPDVTIYQIVLGTWAVPVVSLAILYFFVRTIPYLMYPSEEGQEGTAAGEGEES